MNRPAAASIVSPILAMMALLSGCERPTSDPVKLEAIGTEANTLMATYPAKIPEQHTEVPKSRWPAAIASLHPELVTVHEWGVDILIKRNFDGGWGYHVANGRRKPPMLQECYSEVSPGVFWHDPC